MGIKIISLYFGISLWLCQVMYVQAQPVQEDPKARELLELGKRYLKTHNYLDAVASFEAVDKTRFNTVSTAAIYLSGIAWLEEGNKEKALSKFNRILNYYPESKYTQEARYHKSLILLQDLSTREYGLKMLMDVIDNSRDKHLQQQGKDAIYQFLFYETDIRFLDYYLKVVRESYKSVTAEALCWQYIQIREFEKVVEVVNRVDSTGKRLSPRLKLIKETCTGLKSPEVIQNSKLQVNVMMPFFASDQDSGLIVSSRSLISLEFLEGMKMAADIQKAPYPLEVEIMAWDIKRDSNFTRKILEKEFTRDNTDIIIGSYFNNESRVISDWCERNEVLHLVPYSPEKYLVDNRKHVFLASPALHTHASRMADYAVRVKQYKNIAVFTDEERFAKTLTEEFVKSAEHLKAQVTVKKYANHNDKALTQIPDLVKQLAQSGVEAVYIPTGDEEIASLILNHLKLNRMQPLVMGSPEFRNFRAIDKELMDQFQIVFSDAVFEMNMPRETESLIRRYAEEYGQRLTPNVVRGYDLMNWLLYMHTHPERKEGNFSKWVRTSDKWMGMNQNFYFKNHQDNQSLFILGFEGRTFGKVYEY